MRVKGKHIAIATMSVLGLVVLAVVINIADILIRPGKRLFPLEPIDAASIRLIEYENYFNGQQGTARRDANGEWFISARGMNTEWPASIPAVRSATRAIANISELDQLNNTTGVDEYTQLIVTTETEQRHLLFIESTQIGGKQTVVIDKSAVRAPSELLAPLIAGPLAWRERAVFPNTGTNVTRLLIQQPATEMMGGLEVDLTKTAGRWLVASPVLARADTNAVESAIGRVAGAVIERFLDEPPTLLETGLDDPIFIITVETGDGSRRVRFGANADASGVQRFATTGEAGVLFVADTELLRELRLDPAAYTDRRVTAVPAADVHGVLIEEERATRTLSGWTDAGFDAGQVVATLAADGDSVVSFEEPAGFARIATITLEDLAGDPLDVIGVGRDGAGGLYAVTRMPGGGPVYYTLAASFGGYLPAD